MTGYRVTSETKWGCKGALCLSKRKDHLQSRNVSINHSYLKTVQYLYRTNIIPVDRDTQTHEQLLKVGLIRYLLLPKPLQL